MNYVKPKNMKKTLLLALLCLTTLSLSAKCVIITLKNGTLVYYQLGGEKNPVMTFSEGKATMNDDTFEISDIKNFYISNEDAPDAIDELPQQPTHRFVAGSFSMKAESADEARVFTVNGTEVKAPISYSDGYASVKMDKLAKGIYVIKVGESSFKVTKK